MALSTNNNVMALNVGRSINRTSRRFAGSLSAVGSGLRIRTAADDAAGLSVSEGLRSQLTKLTQNVRNAEHATDLLRVAEGSMATATEVLQRMRVLAMRSSNGHLTDVQRRVLTAEFNEASAALDRIAQATVYNNRVLLTGFATVDEGVSTALTNNNATGVVDISLSGAEEGFYVFEDDGSGQDLTLGNGTVTQTIDMGTLLDGGSVAYGTKIIANFDRLGVEVTLAGDGAQRAEGAGGYVAGDLDGQTIVVVDADGGDFQVGPTTRSADRVPFDLPDLRAAGELLNLGSVSLASQPDARLAITTLDLAIGHISTERGRLGSLLNRLTHSISFSENEIESMTDSESTIRDADMAQSATEIARNEILSNTSTVMISAAYANARRALVLL
jgi:flagellin